MKTKMRAFEPAAEVASNEPLELDPAYLGRIAGGAISHADILITKQIDVPSPKLA